MADKLKQGISVLTTFVDGETPTAAKLSSITAQLRNAAEQLEQAVGDIHDESYPYSTSTTATLSPAWGRTAEGTPVSGASTRALEIANIARLIGPASNLNPEVIGGSRSVTQDVPAEVHEFALKYPPASGSSFTFSDTTVFDDEVSGPLGLDADGDYYITDDGKVYTVSATDSTTPGTVQYTIDPDEWFGGPNYLGARFNVIPDPNQMSTGTGCSVGALDANGRRPVTLPTISHAQFNDDMDNSVLSPSDANYGQQLKLPLILTENYSVGETIPSGFLILKNWTTGEVYADAEYLYNGESSVLIGQVDITTEVDRGDKFCVVTVGTDITTSIDDLRRKMGHTHDRSFGEPFVDVEGISGWTAGPWGSKGSFTASNIEGNYAPQYLHRYGHDTDEAGWNDENAMRGSIVLGATSGSPGSYVNTAPGQTSYSIYFTGAGGSAARIRKILNALEITADDTGGIDLETSAGDIDLKSAGGIDLDAYGGDVRTRGGLHLIYDAGDSYVSSAPHLANSGMHMGGLTGNADFGFGAVGADSLIAGPLNSQYTDGLDLWAIDENGSTNSNSTGTGANHYATTQTTQNYDSTGAANGWVVPAFQVIHYAQWNRSFTPKTVSGGSPAQWDQMAYLQANIKLPDYLYDDFANNMGGNAVLGYTVMVKSPDVNNRWWTVGGSGRYGTDNGERIISYLDESNTVSSNNEIQILIATDGNTDQNFYWERLMNIEGGSSGGAITNTSGGLDIDIKIVAIVASPTNSVAGTRAVI